MQFSGKYIFLHALFWPKIAFFGYGPRFGWFWPKIWHLRGFFPLRMTIQSLSRMYLFSYQAAGVGLSGLKPAAELVSDLQYISAACSTRTIVLSPKYNPVFLSWPDFLIFDFRTQLNKCNCDILIFSCNISAAQIKQCSSRLFCLQSTRPSFPCSTRPFS